MTPTKNYSLSKDGMPILTDEGRLHAWEWRQSHAEVKEFFEREFQKDRRPQCELCNAPAKIFGTTYYREKWVCGACASALFDGVPEEELQSG